MKIEEVIDESVLAVFENPVLSRRLVLKGGSAIRMLERDRSRLSIDADFSLRGRVTQENAFFRRVEGAVSRRFAARGYRVVDFRATPRPRRLKPNMPGWWRGWLCEFKLVDPAFAELPPEARSRRAIIPEGANSSVMTIEISEHEYCGVDRTKKIRGVVVHGYTRELLVLEKLRAICQQHPNYRFRSNKNRSRDFYDIYQLCTGKMGAGFLRRCRAQLQAVFDAKEVPLLLLNSLWDEKFLSNQRGGFAQVADSTTHPVRDFDVYVEFLRYFILQIVGAHVSLDAIPSGEGKKECNDVESGRTS